MQLATFYTKPGFLLLASNDAGDRLGCVGGRDLGPLAARPDTAGAKPARRCEVRRMFVRSPARGTGLGRQLAGRVIEEARNAGFDELVLNTLPAMTEARALYDSLGFEKTEPYVEEPLEGVLYYRLKLETA